MTQGIYRTGNWNAIGTTVCSHKDQTYSGLLGIYKGFWLDAKDGHVDACPVTDRATARDPEWNHPARFEAANVAQAKRRIDNEMPLGLSIIGALGRCYSIVFRLFREIRLWSGRLPLPPSEGLKIPVGIVVAAPAFVIAAIVRPERVRTILQRITQDIGPHVERAG